ncbi:MAG: transcription termination/antitermination protein NusG [Christensenellales bacterium]|jgi:transcriptional antiterminator NusG
MENKEKDIQWYVVSTYSGRENIVRDNLLMRRINYQLEDKIHRVVVAEVEEPVIKDGIKTDKVKMKNLYPGYVFIEMEMTDEAWYIVRNTPDVTGFVGSSGGGTKPFPVPREQIEPVLKRMGEVDDTMYSHYHEGDVIKIIHGPFEGMEGKILSIDKETGNVVIELIIFGRPTETTIDFGQIEKS